MRDASIEYLPILLLLLVHIMYMHNKDHQPDEKGGSVLGTAAVFAAGAVAGAAVAVLSDAKNREKLVDAADAVTHQASELVSKVEDKKEDLLEKGQDLLHKGQGYIQDREKAVKKTMGV